MIRRFRVPFFFTVCFPSVLLILLTLLGCYTKYLQFTDDRTQAIITVVSMLVGIVLYIAHRITKKHCLREAFLQTTAISLMLVGAYLFMNNPSYGDVVLFLGLIAIASIGAQESIKWNVLPDTMLWQHMPYTAAILASYLAFQGFVWIAYGVLAVLLACHFSIGLDLYYREASSTEDVGA